MTEYITIAQADELLGSAWTTEDKKARAVLMANTWLTGKRLPAFDQVPDAVVQAGAEVAREAAAGKLYASKGREVLSETKQVDGAVSKSTTYAQGSVEVPEGVAFALALLAPYLNSGGQTRVVRG